MGCSASKPEEATRSMMSSFLPDEQTALLSAVNSSHNDLISLKSKYPFVPEGFLVALNTYCRNYGGQLNEATLSTAIYQLRVNGQERDKFFTQGYLSKQPNGELATQSFVKDLAQSAMGFYPQPGSSKPISERFLDFCLNPKVGDSLDIPSPSTPPRNAYVDGLWKLVLDRLFLTTPERLKDDPENTARSKGLKGPVMASSVLLAPEDVWLLETHIPADHKAPKWECVFDSTSHGASWTVFKDGIEERGTTLIVIRDKKGFVFGGYASSQWKHQPKWFGDGSCFLFRLQPDIHIYPATGYNQNYQWFEYGTQSLPNGLGMGGQQDYFALWISAQNFLQGHSKGNPSTTYNSTVLAGGEEFTLDYVEAWLVKEKYIDPNLLPERKGKKSILDGNAEDSMILEMAGRKMYSKDVKAADEKAKRDGEQQDFAEHDA